MPAPLLQVKDLQVSFTVNGQPAMAVNGISFSVQPGEILGIVGESGSGKSITAMSILRLLPDHARIGGQVLLQPSGEGPPLDIHTLPEAAMRALRGHRIGMIFQEPMSSLNPLITCGRQVMEVIQLHRHTDKATARTQTLDLFRQVQLPDPEQLLDRYPHELSGGQKQRVMIAMAISCNPSLLIADEPTTALDVTVQKEILQLLGQLQAASGMSILFITHDLGVIASLAHRVMVMYKGQVVEEGLVQEVFAHPVHAYTKSLLACRPPADRRLQRLPMTSDFMEVDALGHMLEKQASVQDFLHTLELPPMAWEKRAERLAGADILIDVRNLHTLFPGRRNIWGRPAYHVKAVDDVSFNVRQGEILGLVGESGSGKTTLGRTLLRLVEPASGSMLYKGEDLRQYSAAAMRALRRDMQLVFQDPYASLNPRLTIGQAIQEPLRVHGMLGSDAARKARVLEWLERVQLLPAHYNRYPHEFSGGQRQRIVMARALALEPSFVICDEPVSALDVSIQAQVLNLLMGLRRAMGFTCIFISHDLGVVRYVSDRIMVMQQGKIRELGPADEVYGHPQSPYTRQLLAAIPGQTR